MGYQPNDKEAKLPRAVDYLKGESDVRGKCLGYTRSALATVGMLLPPPQSPHSTALACYHALAPDPSKYGWQKVGYPAVHPITLVFFSSCGTEVSDDGSEIVCGHVALWEKATGVLRSSKDYPWSPYWAARLVGEFVPLP